MANTGWSQTPHRLTLTPSSVGQFFISDNLIFRLGAVKENILAFENLLPHAENLGPYVEFSEKKIDNPKSTNTAESQTPRRQTLRRVSKFIFQKSKSFYSNTVQSRTPCRLILRGVLPASILYVQASPCLNRESKIRKYRVTTYMKIAQHFC